MAKINKPKPKAKSHPQRATPYPLPSHQKKYPKASPSNKIPTEPSEKTNWDNTTCSVCLEFPHNAVLLLCSSHNKGCRPFMCATSRRFSNCLSQFKKAYSKVTTKEELNQSNRSARVLEVNEKTKAMELLCPLCRGQVKGWTVVEPARKYFNSKRRACLQENCSFSGTFKQLKKHVKAKHPLARPRAVDPVLEQKWKVLERQTERSDVISTILSSTPGAIVLGDYVIEPGRQPFDDFDYESDDSLRGGFYPEPFHRSRLQLRVGLGGARRIGRLRGVGRFTSRSYG